MALLEFVGLSPLLKLLIFARDRERRCRSTYVTAALEANVHETGKHP